MWIHLLRHGIAVDRDDPACPPDPERDLTGKGKARTRAAAKGTAVVEISRDLVIVSRHVPAQQTADVAVDELGAREIARETIDALTPIIGDPARVNEAVRAAGASETSCVGHAPNLDPVATHRLGAEFAVTQLEKAGVASVQCGAATHRGGACHSAYRARVLRRLAGGR